MSMELCKIDRRPWGMMLKIIHTQRFWLKYICVRGRTSTQSHKHRTEYHVSIRGIRKILPNEVHRMDRGYYLELAFGFPAEEDIIRYEDDYGRI
jgi:hypothetical protein